jgi:DNA-binding CsgD family transcriptional regulator
MAALAHAHARAFLDRRVDGLVDAGGGFADRGMPVEAADAVAQAAKIAARSDPLGSRRLANRATSMAAAAGGFDSPALRAVAAELPLTPRQRQIADLAASGLSNRAIADRMGIGVRTVESHLDAAYRRLGVTSRNQLSGLLSGSPTSS